MSIDNILERWRKEAASASFSKESTKGNAFEELCVAFLANDPAMRMVCRNPMLRKRWAEIHGRYGKDAGIDFITEIRGEEGLCAVQCKFYKNAPA